MFAIVTALTYDKALGIKSYLVKKLAYNKIYENYYVEPKISELNTDKTKNLIYIYLESMENTYADEVSGFFAGHIPSDYYEFWGLDSEQICSRGRQL